MTEELRRRRLGLAFEEFVPNTVLKAAALNEAFEGLRWEAALCAAAPHASGLFRPWWCDEAVNSIVLGESGANVETTSLFLVDRGGRPVYVPPITRSLNVGDWLYLDSQGEASASLEVPEGATPLARRLGSGTLRVEAEIATIDATPEVGERHRAALGVAAKWLEDLLDHPAGDFNRLVNAFSAVPRAGRETAGVLDRFVQAAGSVGRHLARAGVLDQTLDALTARPESMAASTVSLWLEAWSKVLGNSELRAHVVSEADWLSPVFRAKGTELDGLREHRFNIAHLGKAELVLHSSDGLEGARWRFGTSGERRVFTEPQRNPDETWRASLPEATSGVLVVWTKSENVRLQVMRNPRTKP